MPKNSTQKDLSEKRYHTLFFQNPGLENNNTFLHRAIRNFTSMRKFEADISGINTKALQAMY